ncbi:hypothetical protein WG908_10255 [Sphingobium sp. AN641]|uniref:hypothetical protein n=1 Tax=Sphingobium sp. AN641 TaxID=3133443 RepID=UPI0030C0231F
MIDPDNLSLSNKVASLLMAAGAPPTTDEQSISRVHERLDGHLVETFTELLSPLVASARQGGDGAVAAVSGLVAAVARLQADMFLIKSQQAGPAATEANVLPTLESVIAMRTTQREATDLIVELPPETLGHGWDVESREGGRFWRWMSPEPRATLVVPAVGVGDFIISAQLDAMVGEQFDTLVIRVNGEDADVAMTRIDNGHAEIMFAASVAVNGSNFMFIEFEIGRTYSPHELHGSLDERMLGVGLSHLRIRRAGASAALAG